MKIAVVGAGGLAGTALLKYWNQFAIAAGSPQDELVSLDLPDFDLCFRSFAIETMASLRPDLIINAAGINNIDWLEEHPNSAMTFHCHGTANLREAARQVDAKLVQISCAEVFYRSESECKAPTEEEEPISDTIFGRTKAESERVALEYENSLLVRTSTLFGQSGPTSSGNVVESLLSIFRRTRTIQALNDRTLAPLWTFDFVQSLYFLVKQNARGIFHLAGKGTATPYSIAEFLLRHCGLQTVKPEYQLIPITLEQFGTATRHSKNIVLNTEKYQALPSAPPLPDWQDSLVRFLDSRVVFH